MGTFSFILSSVSQILLGNASLAAVAFVHMTLFWRNFTLNKSICHLQLSGLIWY